MLLEGKTLKKEGKKKKNKKRFAFPIYLIDLTVNSMSSQPDIFSTSGYYVTHLVMQSEGGLLQINVAIP